MKNEALKGSCFVSVYSSRGIVFFYYLSLLLVLPVASLARKYLPLPLYSPAIVFSVMESYLTPVGNC